MDLFSATLCASLMVKEEGDDRSLEEQQAWLQRIITQVCDATMLKAKYRPPRKAYWWSEEIADLRRASDQARRMANRTKRRGGNAEEYDNAWALYRAARDNLCIAIRRVKAQAWAELLDSLNEDPRGRPSSKTMRVLTQVL